MARKGRPPVLDEMKKREIVAILSVGCSIATAARYVGCAPSTIRNTAQRDPRFDEQMRRTENRAEVEYMKSIQQAARQEKYWRAAAWALERKNPDAYGMRSPMTLTMVQVEQFAKDIATTVGRHLSSGRARSDLLNHLNHFLLQFLGPEALRIEPDDPSVPLEP